MNASPIDQRRPVYSLEGSEKRFVELARSVGCLVQSSYFKDGALQATPPLLIQKLRREFPEAKAINVNFHDEWTLGGGTAFLIAKDLVLTAAHSLFDRNHAKGEAYTSFVVIFDYLQHGVRVFSKNQVYSVAAVVAYELKPEPLTRDWAILKLDRPVCGRSPLKVDFSGKITLHDEGWLLGYPNGGPQKLTGPGEVLRITQDYFECKISSFTGNSGSPLFSKDLRVIGMLCYGSKDYSIREGIVNEHTSNHEYLLKMQALKPFVKGLFSENTCLASTEAEETSASLEGFCYNIACPESKPGSFSLIRSSLDFYHPYHSFDISCAACKKPLVHRGVVLSNCTYQIKAEKMDGKFCHRALAGERSAIRFELDRWKISYLEVEPLKPTT